MMEMTQFANELGATFNVDDRPAISILSGNSYVAFRDHYRAGVAKKLDKRRIQWFNGVFTGSRQRCAGTGACRAIGIQC